MYESEEDYYNRQRDPRGCLKGFIIIIAISILFWYAIFQILN